MEVANSFRDLSKRKMLRLHEHKLQYKAFENF